MGHLISRMTYNRVAKPEASGWHGLAQVPSWNPMWPVGCKTSFVIRQVPGRVQLCRWPASHMLFMPYRFKAGNHTGRGCEGRPWLMCPSLIAEGGWAQDLATSICLVITAQSAGAGRTPTPKDRPFVTTLSGVPLHAWTINHSSITGTSSPLSSRHPLLVWRNSAITSSRKSMPSI